MNQASARRPAVMLFDVNETLSDMAPVYERFHLVGAPRELSRTWFAGLLRDGFSLAAAGSTALFADLAVGTLRNTLEKLPLNRSTDEAVDYIIAGFGTLGPHPDVETAVPALAGSGVRLCTLSNGSASIAKGVLDKAGLTGHFERLLSVEDAGVWKPAAGAYAYALRECAVSAEDSVLVAVHPWDIDGASRAGLRTAWINRQGSTYPAYFESPGIEVRSMDQLVERLR